MRASTFTYTCQKVLFCDTDLRGFYKQNIKKLLITYRLGEDKSEEAMSDGVLSVNRKA